MKKVFLLTPAILLFLCISNNLCFLSAKESIRGNYSIVGQVPKKNSINKIIFEEFINFGCSHCNNLHKASKKFREKFSDKVEFTDIPILFKGQNDSPLRLYYVAKKIGKGELVKDELFKTSFENDVNVFDPGIINFLARSLGIYKKFQKEKQQEWVNKMIENGKIQSKIYHITGTPTVVIQKSLKMDISRYGSMSDFIKKIPETIEDLLK